MTSPTHFELSLYNKKKNQATGGLLHSPPNYPEKESFFAEEIIFFLFPPN